MIRSRADGLKLHTVSEVTRGAAAVPPAQRADLESLAAWIREYLAAPHPDLGRPGNVCPFIPQALERDTVYVALLPGNPSIPGLARRMLKTLHWFRARADGIGQDAVFLTAITILPGLAPARIVDVIEGVQALLKPQFLRAGAMIGEFHPLPPSRAGLWNPEFRPFACPFPALAIRHMVPADFPFVEADDEQVRRYLERFADAVPAHLAHRVEERIEASEDDLLPSGETVCSECGQAMDTTRATDPAPASRPTASARVAGARLG